MALNDVINKNTANFVCILTVVKALTIHLHLQINLTTLYEHFYELKTQVILQVECIKFTYLKLYKKATKMRHFYPI